MMILSRFKVDFDVIDVSAGKERKETKGPTKKKKGAN